jgi:predicted lipoprotein with Yx(FWY)xxD motif
MPAQGEPTGGPGVDGELGTITRDDGSMQITYDGMPLYMCSSDPSPGDTNGDGFGGLWHVVSLD